MKLSISYKAIPGDTFESISRKNYGSENFTDLIKQSNPGLEEPFSPGISITIPDQPDAPKTISQTDQLANDKNEAALMINGKRFRFWDSVRITRSIDAMDLIDFGAPFEENNNEFRSIFRPMSYQSASFTVGGELLFSGTLISINPLIDKKKKTIIVSGYSLPGVLNDCTAPASAYAHQYSLEFVNQGLANIATKVSSFFGISVDFQTDQGATFEQVALEPSRKVLAFLSNLAQKKNIIISSTPDGKLLFQKSIDSGVPVAKLKQGESPVVSVIPFLNPQEYYSHITGIVPNSIGVDGPPYTKKNEHLNGIIRPLTFLVPDTEAGDIELATNAKTGRMFANAISYDVFVDTWRDSSGKLWEPNTIINLLAPGAMVYNDYSFLIRRVTFEKTFDSEVAVLSLVIPGSFSGKIPKELPWEE